MDQTQSVSTLPRPPKRIIGLLVCLGIFVLLYFLLGSFDNSTELTPNHDYIAMVVFFIAGVNGAVWCGVALHSVRRKAVSRQIGTALPLLLLGFVSALLFLDRSARLAEGLIDFPRATTHSLQAHLVISRAYQTHGKGRSWNIQTTPIWSNLDITEDDYNFMISHRRQGDTSRDPDEISSRGYFCANVTLEQSGDALRVMNAGSKKLPRGTVIACPQHEERTTR